LVVFVPGGGFSGGDKEDGQQTAAMKALNRGYADACVNYRLSGEARFPAAVNVKLVLDWLDAQLN
jgi:acetyl esterase/lipase